MRHLDLIQALEKNGCPLKEIRILHPKPDGIMEVRELVSTHILEYFRYDLIRHLPCVDGWS